MPLQKAFLKKRIAGYETLGVLGALRLVIGPPDLSAKGPPE